MNPELEVPTIDVRERIPERVIQALARLIAEQFKPQIIILFGSYARGNPRPESDVDLLIIMDARSGGRDITLEIRRSLDARFGLDLIVYSQQKLEERLEMGDSFLQDAIREGKILYESSPG